MILLFLKDQRIMETRYQYLLFVQFLGFRFRGWQHQPGQQTVEGMLKKTLKYILPGTSIKLLASGRTDAKVSARSLPVSLILPSEITNSDSFLNDLNANLPPDIRVNHIEAMPFDFNVIKDVVAKEYHYYFSNEADFHPNASPFIGYFRDPLNIPRMREAAPLFEGTHHFEAFCSRPGSKSNFERTISRSKLELNTYLTAPFLPETTYAYLVKGSGFLRYQIRMMLGALVMLGRDEIHEDDILAALEGNPTRPITTIAPGSGLLLHQVFYK